MRNTHIPSQRELLRCIRRQGWTITKDKKHYRCRAPWGEIVVMGATCSDYRAIRNIRSEFRKRGVDL